MKVSKKIISFLVLLAMLIQLFSVSVLASEGVTEDNIDVQKEVSVLSYLGITDGDIATAEPMTRGEFSKVVANMICAQPYFKSQYFKDVDKANDYAGYINALADYGVISLSSERMFEPERPVTLNEMYKMLLCAMGYNKDVGVATMSDYMMCAARNGIDVDVLDDKRN